MDLNEVRADHGNMYEITCPTTGHTEHLTHREVLSSHRVRKGHVVYLRCTCGEVVMWTNVSVAGHHPKRTLATTAA